LPYLDIRVVDEGNSPVSRALVTILIRSTKNKISQNNLTAYTDDNGIVHFEFAQATSAHIYVNGILELLNVGLDCQVTVSI